MKNYFQGKVLNGGFSCKKWYEFLAKLEGKIIGIFAESLEGKRSNQYNSYMWSAVIDAIADYSGNSKDAIHSFIEDKFADREWVQVGRENRLVLKTCSTLKRGEFDEFVKKVKLWAQEDLDITFQEDYDPL